MSYDDLRTFADSYGLAATMVLYLVLIVWPFRPGGQHHHETAAVSIFGDEADKGETHNG